MSAGYGGDPNLVTPAAPWPRTLTPVERAVGAALADVLLSPREGFPLPSALGIADFLDEWVSAPYPKQEKDRALVTEGLAALDEEARRRFGKSFAALSDVHKCDLVDEIVAGPFFQRFRYLIVGGYFTSDVGMRAIGYVGNVPRAAFPAVSSEVRAIVDSELRRLGL